MKILLYAGALSRVGAALKNSGLELELYVADQDGAITHDGQTVAPEAVHPEVVWASLDTFMGGVSRVFFKAAVSDPAVKWMQTFNAGLDLPIFKDIVRKGVRLTNSSAQAVAIAEYVMGQVAAEWYPIAQYREAQAKHEWRRVAFRELSQSHWLIVGYGNIGREVARRAKGFGARVTGVRRTPKADEFADEMAKPSDVARVLPTADVVVLACGLNDETRDMVDAAFLREMKSGSFLVNVGRGGLVDETALLAALDAGKPALAILDVVREEPLPGTSPLWDHSKVRLTAHTSAVGSGTVARGDQLFLDNLALYAAGKRLINEVGESFF